MKICAFPRLSFNNNQPYHIGTTASGEKKALRNGDYAPLYYKDYNVNLSFKGRSPEDFYSQDFNKKYMPYTMAEYLYADFNDRQHLAPVQLMSEAFDDLAVASTVDDIHELYPNEPLFEKLKPANYFNASRGVLRKIGEVKTEFKKEGLEPEPLFNDGSDDLTTYIVKKIFLEGKTVNEIDKDFENDLNDLYKGIIKSISSETSKSVKAGESKYFSNSTTYSLGIRFPNISFWNSFINTRDDYAHVERKKVNGKFENTNSKQASTKDGNSVNSGSNAGNVRKPRRLQLNEPRVKQIADTIADSKGDMSKIKHGLNNRARGTKELSFVQKYWSEIMSVAVEKIHLSEELSMFYDKLNREKIADADKDVLTNFVNGNDLSGSQTGLLKRFWNYHSKDDLRDNFSLAISSTIKEFAEAYDEDGFSEEFEIMLNYARNIKPNRENAKRLHDEIQAEYDRLAEVLAKQEIDSKSIEDNSLTDTDKSEYRISIGDDIYFNSDIDVCKFFEDSYKYSINALPDSYINAELRDFRSYFKSQEDYNKFALSFSKDDFIVPEFVKDKLYTVDEAVEIANSAKNIYKSRSYKLMNMAHIAILDYYIKNGCTTEALKRLDGFDLHSISALASFLSDAIYSNEKDKIIEAKKSITETYNSMQNSSLSNKDKRKINDMICDYVKSFDTDKMLYFGDEPQAGVLLLISNTISSSPTEADCFKKFIYDKMDAYESLGSVVSYLLKEDAEPVVKNFIIERILSQYVSQNAAVATRLITYNKPAFDLIMNKYPEFKERYETFSRISNVKNMSLDELFRMNESIRRKSEKKFSS